MFKSLFKNGPSSIASTICIVVLLAALAIGILATQPHPPAPACGGTPRTAPQGFFPGRAVRSVASEGNRLWAGFNDGGLAIVTTEGMDYFVEECKGGPTQHSGSPVNDILVDGDEVHFATDGNSIWKFSGGEFTMQTLSSLETGQESRFYSLFRAGSGGYAASYTGMFFHGQDDTRDTWIYAAFLTPPETSQHFDAVGVFRGGRTCLGGIETGLFCWKPDGSWVNYNAMGEWQWRDDKWEQINGVSYPEKIRSISTDPDGNKMFIAADDEVNGLMTLSKDGPPVFITGVPLSHLVRVDAYDGDIVISDWKSGSALWANGKWRPLTTVPSFGSAVFNSRLWVATANGLESSPLPWD